MEVVALAKALLKLAAKLSLDCHRPLFCLSDQLFEYNLNNCGR